MLNIPDVRRIFRLVGTLLVIALPAAGPFRAMTSNPEGAFIGQQESASAGPDKSAASGAQLSPKAAETLGLSADEIPRQLLEKNGPGSATVVDCSTADECLRKGEALLKPFPQGDRARPFLAKAIQLDPSVARAYKDLVSLLMRAGDPIAVGHPSEKDYAEAEAACRTAISLDPNDAETYLLLGGVINGEVYSGSRSDDGAVEPLLIATQLRPDWPDSYCELGYAYKLLKRYDEAVAAYTTEMSLRRASEPMDSRTGPTAEYRKSHMVADAYTVAEICTKTGQYNEGLRFLLLAESVDPDDEVIRFQAGKLDLNLGNLDSARREQEQIARICKSKNKFLITECEGYSKGLLTLIEQNTR